MRLALLTAPLLTVAALMAAGAAQAATVEIKDAVMQVTVVPENRSDVKVEIVRANDKLPLSVRTEGDRTVIDGGLWRQIRNCNGMGDHAKVRVSGVGELTAEDMPRVVIHTPMAVVVSAGGAVSGTIGRSASLDLHNSGCSAWTIADVAGQAAIHESGAGSVRMGASDRLDVRVSGAAQIHATRVRGLAASLSGAGGVRVERLDGPMDARVSGVGQIKVADGRASNMRASVSGVGGVEFGGVAQTLDASISGFGGVRVNEVTGQITRSVSGGGSVTVAGQTIGKRS